MKPLTPADIPAPAVFEAARAEFRARIIAHKARRRVAVGAHVTLLFEDRETLRWQVLEMCRVEGTRSADGVQHELDVYNALLPGARELSATLFIEITELKNIRPELDRLIGLDEHVELRVGGAALRAHFDEKQLEADRLSAVQYLRFVLSEEQVRAFRDPAQTVSLAISHPAYAHETTLEAALRETLARDFDGGAAPLLDFAKFANATPKTRTPEIAHTVQASAREALRLFQTARADGEDSAFTLLEKVLVTAARARAFAERAAHAARNNLPDSAQNFEARAAEHAQACVTALTELNKRCEQKP